MPRSGVARSPVPVALTAVSEHPVPAQAVAECAGDLLERGAVGADLLWVAAGPAFGGAMADVVDALRQLLAPRVTVAVVSGVVLGGTRVLDDGVGLAVLAVSAMPCRPLRVRPGDTLAAALAGAGLDDIGTVIVAADPFTVRPDDLAAPFTGSATVVGGLLAAGRRPGGNLMMTAGPLPGTVEEHRDGAVAVVVGPVDGVDASVVRRVGPDAPGPPVPQPDGLPLHTDGRTAVLCFTDLDRILPPGAGVPDDVALLAEWRGALVGIGVGMEVGPLDGSVAVLRGATAVVAFG